MQKQFFNGWFSFTHKERTGVISLLAIILFLMIIPFIFPLFIHHTVPDHRAFEKEIAALTIKQADSSGHPKRKMDDNTDTYQPYYQPNENKYPNSPGQKGELFYFDPNTLAETGWQRLGVREKTIGTIKNYLSKGGRFRTAEDIKKIWGFDEALAAKIIPYIKIESSENTPVANVEENHRTVYENKKTTAGIDINTADTTAFIALPGIGTKLAQRIISFRDKLGGFYKIDQLAETFGLPDSTYQKIKPRLAIFNTTIKQVNINTASFDELKNHPYLRYNIANAIIQYRSQHGRFSSLYDLKRIMLVTDDVFNKIQPYLTL